MLNNQGQAAEIVKMLDPVSAAATANATSAWIDARKYEGDLVVSVQVGALTGSITWSVESASDGTGTGAAALTPNEGAFTAGAANQTQKRTFSANAIQGWIRVIGTIVTGPALVAAHFMAHPKNTS